IQNSRLRQRETALAVCRGGLDSGSTRQQSSNDRLSNEHYGEKNSREPNHPSRLSRRINGPPESATVPGTLRAIPMGGGPYPHEAGHYADRLGPVQDH